MASLSASLDFDLELRRVRRAGMPARLEAARYVPGMGARVAAERAGRIV